MEDYNIKKLKEFKSFFANNISKKKIVISGFKSFNKSGANKILSFLLKDKNTIFFFNKSFIPELLELKKIIQFIKNNKPDIIIAIGGGSVLDYAKIACVLYKENNIKIKIIRNDFKNEKKIPLVAIPTTAGSGAEVTANAVIYINKIKFSVEHNIFKPNYFFIIPSLIIKSPKKIKASSGFDAISQSIESIISRKSNQTSLNFAKKSLKISLKNYLNYLHDPNNDNTFKMAISANLSGKAISISKTNAPHALSYPFTSIFNISHGHAVSLTLNDFLKFNFFHQNKANCDFNLSYRYSIIFDLFNVKTIYELDEKISFIKKKALLENNFSNLGINIKNDYNKILNGVNLQRLNNNPVDLTKKDIKHILLNNV